MRRSTEALFRRVLGIGSAAAFMCAMLILRSADTAHAGINVWTSHGPGTVAITALAIDPATPTTLYAGADGFGAFKSTDAGSTWSNLLDGSVNALAIDPTTPSTLYAGTDAGLFKSTDAGGTWSAAPGLPVGASVIALAIDPVTPTTLYAGASSLARVFKSTDAGATWSAADTGLPVDDSATTFKSAFAIDPVTPSILYYAVWTGGVFKSSDAGGTWTALGLEGESIAIDPVTPSTLYVGTGFAGGVSKSTDAGRTWVAVNVQMPGHRGVSPSIPSCAARPTRKNLR